MPIKSDIEIKRDIEEQLAWDSRVDAIDVKVEVKNGRVELKGSVPTNTAMRAAVNDAYWVDGVSYVENQLAVSLPKTESVNDAQIKANVKATLFWDIDIRSRDIGVIVERGVVILLGNVDAYWKKVKAEEKILNLFGVLNVINKIAIVPTRKRKDKEIADQIIKAIEKNPAVNVDNINIRVENGIVTLSGNVSSWYDHDLIFGSTLYTDGITDVIDNLHMVNIP